MLFRYFSHLGRVKVRHRLSASAAENISRRVLLRVEACRSEAAPPHLDWRSYAKQPVIGSQTSAAGGGERNQ